MLYTGQQIPQCFPILLVEDDPTTVATIQRVAKSTFPEAHFINKVSFSEAKQFFYSIDDMWPKLIIVDIYLIGEATELEFLEFLKNHPSGLMIPVVVLSASQSREHIDSAYAFGAAGYITKPFALAEWKGLLTALRSYWGSTDLPHQLFFIETSNLN